MTSGNSGSERGTERVGTVIIGAGQAGLATGYHLGRLGRDCVILDSNSSVGDNWRRHWDSLRLYSPARYDSLPGMPFASDAWSYPGKDEMADYLRAYAERFELPVRGGIRVDRLTKTADHFVVTAGDYEFHADNVVVATGTFGKPYTPDFAADLDPAIRQLHSSEYKRPAQLRDGGVLVVGASHSGGDVAYEVAANHDTVLCGRDTGQIPFKLNRTAARRIFPVMFFMANRILTIGSPIGRKMRPEIRSHGGPLLRYKRADLAAVGVERVFSRVAGVSDGKPMLDDGRVLDVANVIWCTGFRQDFSWIDLPVTGDDGWPLELRGVVADAPGLYFVGLAFQRAFASMLVGGASVDAQYVARHIVARRAALTPTSDTEINIGLGAK